MALDQNILQAELSKVLNSEDPSFLGFTDNSATFANRFANALGVYSGSIVPPSGSIPASEAAAIPIITTLIPDGNGLDIIEQAVQAFCIALAPGMAGYISTPPPGLPDYQPLLTRHFSFEPPYISGENLERCRILAEQTHIYFITGTATPIGGGGTINWS